jgi:hypothetical protein
MSIFTPVQATEVLPIPRVQRQGIELAQHLYATLPPDDYDRYTLVVEVADRRHGRHERSGPCEAIITVHFCSDQMEPCQAAPDSGLYQGGQRPTGLALCDGTPSDVQLPFELPGHGALLELQPHLVRWRLTWNQDPHADWAGFILRNVSAEGAIPGINDWRWAFRDRVTAGIAFRAPHGTRVGATTRVAVDWFGPDCGPQLREHGQVESAFFYHPRT